MFAMNVIRAPEMKSTSGKYFALPNQSIVSKVFQHCGLSLGEMFTSKLQDLMTSIIKGGACWGKLNVAASATGRSRESVSEARMGILCFEEISSYWEIE